MKNLDFKKLLKGSQYWDDDDWYELDQMIGRLVLKMWIYAFILGFIIGLIIMSLVK